jgi:hypothetical protein
MCGEAEGAGSEGALSVVLLFPWKWSTAGPASTRPHEP